MKAAKLFKTEIGERRFHRKILRRIHIESERSFVLGLYSSGPGGRYRRPDELSSDDAKRLSRLAGAIKKNRGVVRTGKLSLIAILAAAILIFNFGFKNRLAERALERGLEAVFSARAEVADLDFRILSGRLSFASLSVADRDQPLRNLFELGATEVDLNTPELLKGKLVVSNLESREIRWHTPRQTSGALAEDSIPEPAPEAGAGRGGFSFSLAGLDAKALVEDQLSRLQSPARITELNSRLEELQARWQATVEQGRADVDELAGGIDRVRRMDVGTLGSVPELQQAVAEIQQAAEALRRVGEDLGSANAQIKADRRDVDAARRGFAETVDADVAYLSSLSDLSSGELKNLVSGLAAGYLQQRLGRYYTYAQRARGYAEKLMARKREKTEPGKVKRMQRGVDVAFAAEDYPRFLLANAGVSVQGSSKLIQASIQNISNDPDLIDRPVSFAFLQTEGEQRLEVEGMLDGRRSREADLALVLGAAGYKLELSEGVENLGLSSLSATYRFRTELSRSRSQDAARGQGLLELYDLILIPAAGENQLGTVLYETLEAAATVDVDFDYTVAGGNLAKVSARSSVDAEIARAMEERIAEISVQYQSRLREELTARMAAEIRQNEALSRAFEELVESSDGNLADAAAYREVLDQKQGEVEKRIGGTRTQATDALKSQLEKLPLPKLGF